MSLFAYIASTKDRFKLRMLLDEANDLARDQARCPAGCDAWLLLSYRRAEAIESILAVQQRLGDKSPMSTVECYGLAAVATSVFIALLRVPMVF